MRVSGVSSGLIFLKSLIQKNFLKGNDRNFGSNRRFESFYEVSSSDLWKNFFVKFQRKFMSH
ncbi:hypothetical protein LEP1GSC051_3746 [Leptospira sp. P2653]|nr:hypothetical protein LEP1GSC051_3746 [Leptospira sp. P2653]